MDFKQFERVVETLDATCAAVLLNRAEEYAGEDRLENFKQISALTGIPAPQVCMVLHAKHIFALAKAVREGKYYNLECYIVDIINYQRLLKALLIDAEMQEEKQYGNPLPEAGYIHTRKRPE
jgi:hypothetical protein